ncbi:MAG: SpoVA/SpoVAEb family sporulation membrane protein [Eubacteriales bacterium]
MKRENKEYEAYVKTKTPTYSLSGNMLKAFIVGGIICTIGQVILNMLEKNGIEAEFSGTWTSIILIGISVVLTGINLYPRIANWAGAGALVPITGFANSVASPAIEYVVEGAVNGIGTRIFVIAGPVILYGVFISWTLGVIYYLLQIAGLM